MAKRTPNSATTPYMAEWALKNYLNKHGIHQDQWDLQTIIINSFVLLRGGSKDLPWSEKVIFTQKHFGLFAQYAQNNWRETNRSGRETNRV